MFVDTSFCIDLMRENRRGEAGPATRRLESLSDTPLQMSIFVLCELQAGARLSRRPRAELRKVALLAEHFDLVCPGPEFAVSYGEVEAHLRRRGQRIPTMDLLIGVTAKAYGSPLLTRDAAHFTLIPGLVVETY